MSKRAFWASLGVFRVPYTISSLVLADPNPVAFRRFSGHFRAGCAQSAWFWAYGHVARHFNIPYVRLDEQNGHFGPAWVCFEFQT